jgi:hypothetical protein
VWSSFPGASLRRNVRHFAINRNDAASGLFLLARVFRHSAVSVRIQIGNLRIPRDADQRSELMSITILK